MKINTSKIKERTVVHCNTKDKAQQLIELCKCNDKQMWIDYWDEYGSETCYEITYELDINGYTDKEWFFENDYNVIELDELLTIRKPKVFELLNLEVDSIVAIDGYSSNPCNINEEYSLINSNGDMVSGNWIVKMINDTTIYTVKRRKKMSISEIEKELGYPIEIIQ